MSMSSALLDVRAPRLRVIKADWFSDLDVFRRIFSHYLAPTASQHAARRRSKRRAPPR